MARMQIEVGGVLVDLRSKDDLIKVIRDMNSASSTGIKSGEIKTNARRTAEVATLSFFGSIKHYLEGGSEL